MMRVRALQGASVPSRLQLGPVDECQPVRNLGQPECRVDYPRPPMISTVTFIFIGICLITSFHNHGLIYHPYTINDKQIKQLFSMRSELDARVEELESQLREERKRFETPTTRYDSKNRTNIANTEDIKHELQQSRNQAQEYKLKFHESSQKISALESDIVRLEGQTKRYKAIADACEEQEEILKQDRRKCQREINSTDELREVQSKLEDLKAENARLQRVVDKYNRGSTVPGSLAPGTGSTIRQAHDSSVNR
ncbi:unnamed protein product [Schistosoma margrebowiei]|uniref:Uncharacterized protein n=1 Tax=Schistosoma margrebowiei TaxID=48269 RepID=A0A183MF03_9TREM|nr:unnamed protein product [Schistosoma margrebowiei]